MNLFYSSSFILCAAVFLVFRVQVLVHCEAAVLPPNYIFIRNGAKVEDDTHTVSFSGDVDITADGKTLVLASGTGVYIDTRSSVDEDFQLGTLIDFQDIGFVRKIDVSDQGVVAVVVRNETFLMLDIIDQDKNPSQVWEIEIPCLLWYQPSLAISGHGKTVVYGFGCDPYTPPSPNVFVYVFQLDDDGVTWIATSLDLSEVDVEENTEARRLDVKIPENETTVFVGLSWMEGGTGGVLVFSKNYDDGTYVQSAKLVPDSPSRIGDKIAVNPDGTIVIAVSQSVNSRRGGIWAFKRDTAQSSTWTLVGEYNIPDPDIEPSDVRGYGPMIVTIAVDNTFAIGRYTFKSYQGAVWIFRRIEEAPFWELLERRLEPDTLTSFQHFGFSMGFSQEGSLVVGTIGQARGGAFLFRAVNATSTPSASPITSSPTPTLAVDSTTDQYILVLSAALAGSIGGLILLGLLVATLLYIRRQRRYRAVAFQTPTTLAFLTHEWGEDATHKNHQRVAMVNEELKKLKVPTWFDSDRLSGDVLNQIVAGIDKTSFVIIFLSKRYMEKVAQVAGAHIDYCQMEFQYAVRRRGRDKLIVVVMEQELLDTKTWSGPIGALLGNAIYIDFTQDENAAKVAAEINQEISRRQQWALEGAIAASPAALDHANANATKTPNENKDEQV